MATRILRNVIAKANASIYQAANSQPAVRGMGTTLVVALLLRQPHHAWRTSATHACTAMRDGELQQLTRDHSLLQEQIDSGMISKEMARRSQNKNSGHARRRDRARRGCRTSTPSR